MKKSVHFDSHDIIFHYPRISLYNTDFIRESHRRRKVERCVLKCPHSELKRLEKVIASWRHQDISIVLGNLGRQPFLLNYYLDLCFSHEETIQVVCDWNLSIDYQTRDQKEVDFLIRVEPYFGYTIQKDTFVKHLVILTSHLSLCYWGDRIVPDYLYLSSVKLQSLPDPTLEPIGFLKPPIFHQQVYEDTLPDTILLDIFDSKTAHEAYLRLLTGREIIGKRPFAIRMTERDRAIIKLNLKSLAEDIMLQEEYSLYNWLCTG